MDEIKHSAKLKIIVSQGHDEESTLITDGTVTFINDGIYVEFFEHQSQNHTLIGYSQDTLTLSRLGELSYTMVLHQGKVSTVTVKSEYGDMDINFAAQHISHSLNGNTLDIQLEYTMNAPVWEEPVKHTVSLTGKLGGLI